MKKLRWGVMGTGKIAGTFAKAVPLSETGILISVGSRTQEAADIFGNEHSMTRRHPSYQSLVDDPEVDAIYISLPNHLHAEWTMKCAEAGKHILCEKPFTLNYPEAVRTIASVRKHGVFLMEAFMYRCHPQTAKLQELVTSRVIGEVRVIQAHFSYNMGPKHENIRLSNPAGGGGIMDVGCYTTSMARLIAGAEPFELKGVGYIGPISRVDEQATAALIFPSGLVANLTCGTQVGVDSELRIWGSEGNIRVPNPWFPGEGENKILVNRAGKDPDVVTVHGSRGLYSLEADTVAQYLEHKEAPSPCMTWDDTLGNMAALDAWRRSIGLVFDAEKINEVKF